MFALSHTISRVAHSVNWKRLIYLIRLLAICFLFILLCGSCTSQNSSSVIAWDNMYQDGYCIKGGLAGGAMKPTC